MKLGSNCSIMERRRTHTQNPYSSKSRKPLRSFILFLVTVLFFLTLAINAFFPIEEKIENAANTALTTTKLKIGESNVISNSDSNNDNVIAYAISLSTCAETPSLIDGAAVLAHSIHQSSLRNPSSGSQYDYKLYAIVHHDAAQCRPILEKLGFVVKEVDVPVQVKDIQGDFLREKVHTNGCCGELEYIKLWAYTLVEHPFVVHLDVDTMVLSPMDELFDAAKSGDTRNVDAVMWDKEHHDPTNSEHKQIDAYFTRDYNMKKAWRGPVGVQGGFLVLRPSMMVFEEFKDIIRKGDFQPGKGWGGKGYGPFYGAMTFQGIIPYYYDELHPGTAVELNRCVYNQMADNPRDKRTINDVVSGRCIDGRDECEDCREREISDVKTAHFTLCQKPWHCLPHGQDQLQHRLCRKLFAEWYRIRAHLEAPDALENHPVGEGNFHSEHFRGFCRRQGKKGYIPLKLA